MIESVSTSPVQSVALRSSPQSSNAASAPSQVANPSNFVSSRVRVDNLQNVAILEYRDNEGSVVRQYPTEAQIQAFRRAEHLASEHAQDAKPEQPAQTGGGTSGGHSTVSTSSNASATATPTTGDIVAAAASYSPPAAPGSTQSTTA